jgi:DNA recombination protein RmuC
LNALQMGFRSLAIEKRSSEVWQVLGAVRNEFGKYNSVVDGLAKHLDRAAKSVDTLGTRTRVMARTLKSVETLQDDTAAQKLLGLSPECLQDDLEDEAGVLELLDAQIEVAHTLTS